MNEKIINTSGKRKKAIARATLKSGKGNIKINSQKLEVFSNFLARARISEPITLSGETSSKIDIQVNVKGGGWQSQSEAVRLAIAKALVELQPTLKQTFLDYDRHLLVADTRRTEPNKPNNSKARAKRQKSYR